MNKKTIIPICLARAMESPNLSCKYVHIHFNVRFLLFGSCFPYILKALHPLLSPSGSPVIWVEMLDVIQLLC